MFLLIFSVLSKNDFISHFKEILDLDLYLPKKAQQINNNKEYINNLRELVGKSIYLEYFNICELFNQEDISYSFKDAIDDNGVSKVTTSDTFDLKVCNNSEKSHATFSVICSNISIDFIAYKNNEPVYFYKWNYQNGKYSSFFAYVLSLNSFKENVSFKDDTEEISQETNHQYSKVLKPYNDIIFAFENESKKYEDYKNTITKEVIRDELRANYKKLLSSNEKAEFIADLIMDHYNIPKGNRKK